MRSFLVIVCLGLAGTGAFAADAPGPSSCLELSDIESPLAAAVSQLYTPLRNCSDDACLAEILRRASSGKVQSGFRYCPDDGNCLCLKDQPVEKGKFLALEAKAYKASLSRMKTAMDCISQPEQVLSPNDPQATQAGIQMRSQLDKTLRCFSGNPPANGEVSGPCGQIGAVYPGDGFQAEETTFRDEGPAEIETVEDYSFGRTLHEQESSKREYFALFDFAGRLSSALAWPQAARCMQAAQPTLSCNPGPAGSGYSSCSDSGAADPKGTGAKLLQAASAVNGVSLKIQQETARQSGAAVQAASAQARQSSDVQSLNAAAGAASAAPDTAVRSATLNKQFDNNAQQTSTSNGAGASNSAPATGSGASGPARLTDSGAAAAETKYSQTPAAPPAPGQ